MNKITKNIVDLLNTKGDGQWFTIQWESDLPLTALAKKAGMSGTKRITAQCRKGIRYANMKAIKAKVEAGYVLTHELPWGHWAEGYEGLIIEHKGSEYIRLYFGPNGSKYEYFINGKSYTYEELQASGLVIPSYFKKSDKADCITLNTAKVKKIF